MTDARSLSPKFQRVLPFFGHKLFNARVNFCLLFSILPLACNYKLPATAINGFSHSFRFFHWAWFCCLVTREGESDSTLADPVLSLPLRSLCPLYREVPSFHVSATNLINWHVLPWHCTERTQSRDSSKRFLSTSITWRFYILVNHVTLGNWFPLFLHSRDFPSREIQIQEILNRWSKLIELSIDASGAPYRSIDLYSLGFFLLKMFR